MGNVIDGREGKKETEEGWEEMIEGELVKIRSLADVLITADPHELERNTLPCLAGIIQESVERLRALFQGRGVR